MKSILDMTQEEMIEHAQTIPRWVVNQSSYSWTKFEYEPSRANLMRDDVNYIFIYDTLYVKIPFATYDYSADNYGGVWAELDYKDEIIGKFTFDEAKAWVEENHSKVAERVRSTLVKVKLEITNANYIVFDDVIVDRYEALRQYKKKANEPKGLFARWFGKGN